eukprot:5662-Heterococcus_DN1.PRE.2
MHIRMQLRCWNLFPAAGGISTAVLTAYACFRADSISSSALPTSLSTAARSGEQQCRPQSDRSSLVVTEIQRPFGAMRLAMVTCSALCSAHICQCVHDQTSGASGGNMSLFTV